MTREEKIETARLLGTKAGGSHTPTSRTPCQNRALMELLRGEPIGGASMDVMDAFTAAFDIARKPFETAVLQAAGLGNVPSCR